MEYNNDMLLTEEELYRLTKYRHRPAQARALNRMGITHILRPDTSIAVLRAHVDELLGLTVISKKPIVETPNFDALR